MTDKSALGEDELPQDRYFMPTAVEIGLALHYWNTLHYYLGELFVEVMNTGPARAAWHAVPNERFQRRMLREAASYRYNADHNHAGVDAHPIERHRLYDAIWAEINWIVDSTDKIGRLRDEAAHSPYRMSFDDEETGSISFVPATYYGNPLARSLKDKDLKLELRLFRKRSDTLGNHASKVARAISYQYEDDEVYRLLRRPEWPKR